MGLGFQLFFSSSKAKMLQSQTAVFQIQVTSKVFLIPFGLIQIYVLKIYITLENHQPLKVRHLILWDLLAILKHPRCISFWRVPHFSMLSSFFQKFQLAKIISSGDLFCFQYSKNLNSNPFASGKKQGKLCSNTLSLQLSLVGMISLTFMKLEAYDVLY